MSLRLGLGASQADIDVQGEIDFDFFEASDTSKASTAISETLSPLDAATKPCEIAQPSGDCCPDARNNLSKPLIKISCDDATGAIQKTTIETVIPTPFDYKDNKCGKVSPSLVTRKGAKKSPRLQKMLKMSNDQSDDSSLSSMSESESEISSVSPDSFEQNESDSMTDVSPLASPFKCSTPALGDKKSPSREARKEGVTFEEAERRPCEKCGSIDIRELVSAMKRLKMKQTSNGGSFCSLRCKSPVMTQKLRTHKNLSFTNEEVRKIDVDNKALLKKIIAQQNRPPPPPRKAESPAPQVRAPSAVNRQRQKRQIDMENVAFLKRLEATKASKSLSRNHLLRDYDQRPSGLISRSSSRVSYPGTTSRLSSSSSRAGATKSSLSAQSAQSLSTIDTSSLCN